MFGWFRRRRRSKYVTWEALESLRKEDHEALHAALRRQRMGTE